MRPHAQRDLSRQIDAALAHPDGGVFTIAVHDRPRRDHGHRAPTKARRRTWREHRSQTRRRMREGWCPTVEGMTIAESVDYVCTTWPPRTVVQGGAAKQRQVSRRYPDDDLPW